MKITHTSTMKGGALPVPWREGFALPPRFTARVDDETLPHLLDLEIAVRDGEVECKSVRFEQRPGGEPVTARSIRIRLRAYVDAVAVGAAMRIEETKPGTFKVAPIREDDVVAAAAAARRRAAGRTRMTADHLGDVAEVYNATSRRPVLAVQKDPRWAPVSYATAARWARAARDAGLIETWRPENRQGDQRPRKETN